MKIDINTSLYHNSKLWERKQKQGETADNIGFKNQQRWLFVLKLFYSRSKNCDPWHKLEWFWNKHLELRNNCSQYCRRSVPWYFEYRRYCIPQTSNEAANYKVGWRSWHILNSDTFNRSTYLWILWNYEA